MSSGKEKEITGKNGALSLNSWCSLSYSSDRQQTVKTLVENYKLTFFEGPLELLYLLIHKEELDISHIEIKNLIVQFVENVSEERLFELAPDFLLYATLLLREKSRHLLPPEQQHKMKEEEEELRLELINHLIEYQNLKGMTSHLEKCEEKALTAFPRGRPLQMKKASDGLEEIPIRELVETLNNLLRKNQTIEPGTILDEEWHVALKLQWLKDALSNEPIDFSVLFSLEKSKNELIAIFLALLELIKRQEARIIQTQETLIITQ